MSATRSVAKAGDVAPAPADGQLQCTEIDTGYGDIGYIIEWHNLENGWIMADHTDAFVSLDAMI